LEVDIKPDGRLSIDDDCANLLDGMIVSVHSSFSLPKSAMTKRIIGGLSHRKARILGHPTGRLINQRASFEADWNEIFHFCKNNNKAIEINASPSRLDPPEYLTREALEIGVKIVINTDSHAVDQMDLMKYGVMMARRGWVKKEDVVNTLSFNDLIKWLRDK
jgi:DNA polymerase (family 10)